MLKNSGFTLEGTMVRLRENDKNWSNNLIGQPEKIIFTIDKSQIGQRLDIFLAQSDAEISRSHVKQAIEEGDIIILTQK